MHMGFGDTGHTGYSAILLPGIWDPYIPFMGYCVQYNC